MWWIYITGYIATFVTLIILCLKNEGRLTIGELIAFFIFSFSSWLLFIGFVLFSLLSNDFFEKPIIKRKKVIRTREEIKNSKAYQVSKAALKYYNEHHKDKDIDLTDAFEAGFEYADAFNSKEMNALDLFKRLPH